MEARFIHVPSAGPHPTANVFVSMTSGDLGSMRELIGRGLEAMNFRLVAQEDLPADRHAAAALLEKRMRDCQAVIQIVGRQFGDPAPGARRRSQRQLEADVAQKLGLQLHVFLCSESFPYDNFPRESEDQRALQLAYRREISQSGDSLRTVDSPDDLWQGLWDLQSELVRLGKTYRWQRDRKRIAVFANLLILCVIVGFGVEFWHHQQTAKAAKAAAAAHGAPHAAYLRDNLTRYLQTRAEKETDQVDKGSDPGRLVQIEKRRRQERESIEHLCDQIARDYGRPETTRNYRDAVQILAQRDAHEALRFLQERPVKINPRLSKSQLRGRLQENLLIASLLEKGLEDDQAESAFRAVVAADPTWPEARNSLAALLRERGDSMEPPSGKAKLQEAIEICRGTLTANLRDEDPESWASGQILLGRSLQDLGDLNQGDESLRLFDEAASADKAALEVLTRQPPAKEWGLTQSELGEVLRKRGEKSKGDESARLLGEAAAAYKAALEIDPREKLPELWASKQELLGFTLVEQARATPGNAALSLLDAAASAYHSALEVETLEHSPSSWARIQNTLGVTLLEREERTDGQGGLPYSKDAQAAFEAALLVLRESSAKNWPVTQGNLGEALLRQGELAKGQEAVLLLGEAATNLQTALDATSQAEAPNDWARMEANLGVVLAEEGYRTAGEDGKRLLHEAITIDRAALEIFTRENFPAECQTLQSNLFFAEEALSQRERHEK